MLQHFDITKQDHLRDGRSDARPGRQMRPEIKDAHNEESGGSKDDNTADGGVRVAPSEKQQKQQKLEPDIVHLPRMGQQEQNTACVSMSFESDLSRGSCPHESTFRVSVKSLYGNVLIPRTVQTRGTG